jgi:hypothetical protein
MRATGWAGRWPGPRGAVIGPMLGGWLMAAGSIAAAVCRLLRATAGLRCRRVCGRPDVSACFGII